MLHRLSSDSTSAKFMQTLQVQLNFCENSDLHAWNFSLYLSSMYILDAQVIQLLVAAKANLWMKDKVTNTPKVIECV